MKLLLLLVVVVFGVWLWRNGRENALREDRPAPPPRPPAPVQPQDMVACGLCGLHVPQSDAVSGQRGHYCCADHRRMAEG